MSKWTEEIRERFENGGNTWMEWVEDDTRYLLDRVEKLEVALRGFVESDAFARALLADDQC